MTPMNLALRRQRERLEQVMTVGLGLALADMAEQTQTSTFIATPQPRDYYQVQDLQVEEILATSPVLIQISPNRETRYDALLSGTGRAASTWTTNEIAIMALFLPPAAYSPIERNGKQLIPQEILELMGDAYRGAVIDVVMRDAVDGKIITAVRPLNDFADSVYTDTLGTVGRAVMVFEVKTQALHFSPQYSVASEQPLT